MPLDVRDAARLWDMLDAMRAIIEFTAGQRFESYLADRRTRNAVERNIIAHDYGEIRHEKVWAICRDRLPALVEQLERSGVDNPPSGADDEEATP